MKNGNMLYNNYLKPGSDYFEKISDTSVDHNYELSYNEKRYELIKQSDSVWTYYHNLNNQLPAQGWKIHVTATYDESDDLLKKVGTYCFQKNLSFKHLKDKTSYMLSNSKNGSKSSSGKFITIYPVSDVIFIQILNDLEKLLKDYKKGPYILSDKRWKDSNVFYRYGGFTTIMNENGEPCIKNLAGELILDKRLPFYHCPDFMESMDNHLDSLNIQVNQAVNDSKLAHYDIESALTSSNSGGVYLATVKETSQKVIIKEARPEAGLDGLGRDAVFRQKIEYEALKKAEDCPGIVSLVDYFKEWEHYFLVEEYIEGIDLKQWLALNYPFHSNTKEIDIYCEKVKKIIERLIAVVEQMHQLDVAMGDMQPANILISKDLTITLIDFETALSVEGEDKVGLMTLGFTSQKMTVNGAKDWFGVKKILSFLVLPILASEDLSNYLHDKHHDWIVRSYSQPFVNFYNDIQNHCDQKINMFQPDFLASISEEAKQTLALTKQSPSELLTELGNGIKKYATKDERLIYGDIRQFELADGKFNFLTGGTGAVYAMAQAGLDWSEGEKWINTILVEALPDMTKAGLLTGKAGVLSVLYSNGFSDLVESEIDDMLINLNEKDLTLRSGLSGIGLFMLNLYFETTNKVYFQHALSVEEKISLHLDKEETNFYSDDWAAVSRGLVDGKSGIAIFYLALYSMTKEANYLIKGRQLLDSDLDYIQLDSSGAIQLLDTNQRMLPYLSGGTIGVGVAIWLYNHVTGERRYLDELEAISKLKDIRCTTSGGLFDGAGSFLLLSAIGDSENQKVLNLLQHFLISKEHTLRYAGQFAYRLADDVYSGSAGIMLGLLTMEKGNPLLWLPLINNESFIVSLKHTIHN